MPSSEDVHVLRARLGALLSSEKGKCIGRQQPPNQGHCPPLFCFLPSLVPPDQRECQRPADGMFCLGWPQERQ